MGDLVYLNTCLAYYCSRHKTYCQLGNGVCEISFWDQEAVKDICDGCRYYHPGPGDKKIYETADRHVDRTSCDHKKL